MNILMLGSIWSNADRIFALSDLGHQVIYGDLTFSKAYVALERRITCIPIARRKATEQIKHLIDKHEIDVIYCLLNVYDGSNELIVELLDNNLNFPIVRHYKEHFCSYAEAERRSLVETDGQIYINEHSFEYFREAYGVPEWSSHILDADMIAERYMTNDFSPKIRLDSGQPHIIAAGAVTATNDRHDVRRFCEEMNKRQVHVHLYSRYLHIDNAAGVKIPEHNPTRRVYERMANGLPYVHLHDFIEPASFTRIWSQYDAGVMHARSSTLDNVSRFERMNYPYRYSSYLAAGLPLLVQSGCQDAVEELAQREQIGIVFDDYDDLVEKLRDEKLMSSITQSLRTHRKKFSFDQQAPTLIEILQKYKK